MDTKFTELLRTSLLRESTTKATCSSCKQFVPLASRRIIDGVMEDSLPAVISVNAMVSTPEVFNVWKDGPVKGGVEGSRFLPKQVVLSEDDQGELRFNEEGEGLVYDVTVRVIMRVLAEYIVDSCPDTGNVGNAAAPIVICEKSVLPSLPAWRR